MHGVGIKGDEAERNIRVLVRVVYELVEALAGAMSEVRARDLRVAGGMAK